MDRFIGTRNPFTCGVLTAAVLLALKLPAPALNFNLTFDSSITSQPNALQIETAFTNATLVFQALYTNTMAVNLTVYFSSGVNLGESQYGLIGNPSYGQVTNALRAARTTAADSNSVASLPPGNPIGGDVWWIPNAECKALKTLPAPYNVATNDPGQDGSVLFASTVSYTYDLTNRSVGGKYDFIGVAEHEISEVLGRGFGLNYSGGLSGGNLPYDLFRFTNSVRTFNVNDTNVYFSVDNGVTALKYFYTNVNLGDVQDWQMSSPDDSYDAFLLIGHEAYLSSADLTSLDVLGYALNFHAPKLSGTRLTNGLFQLTFTNVTGLNFSILSSTNIATASTNWNVLGTPIESPAAGQYKFTDSVTNKARFYRVRLN